MENGNDILSNFSINFGFFFRKNISLRMQNLLIFCLKLHFKGIPKESCVGGLK